VRTFGPRFLVEALFLLVVASITVIAGVPWKAIPLVMLLAYLLVVVFEIAASREGAFPGQDLFRGRAVEPPVVEPVPPMPEPQHVHVIPRETEPTAQPVLARRLEPEPEPELEPPPAPEPIPPVLEPLLAEPTPEPERPAFEPEPKPEPEPVPVPQLEVVPPPPAPEPEPEPEPVVVERERVVQLPVTSGPREWNLWELERLVRAHSGDDVLLDEERSFLLVYLRDFATPEGTLPVDFDGLVRESFGEFIAASR
jgi:hypothetical protein